jgi:hypothetical protein
MLPKAPTILSGAGALDLSGRLMKDLRQVSGTPKRDCAALSHVARTAAKPRAAKKLGQQALSSSADDFAPEMSEQ